MAYKKTELDDCILRLADDATIPFDEGNRDYQEYKAWLAEGNTPQEASELTLSCICLVIKPMVT